jgi:hypothetical protein
MVNINIIHTGVRNGGNLAAALIAFDPDTQVHSSAAGL